MFAKLKTEKLINGRMFGQTNNTAESERERERERAGEGGSRGARTLTVIETALASPLVS